MPNFILAVMSDLTCSIQGVLSSKPKIKTITDYKENMVLVGLASPRTRLVPTLFSC